MSSWILFDIIKAIIIIFFIMTSWLPNALVLLLSLWDPLFLYSGWFS